MNQRLPVADGAAVRRRAARLIAEHKGAVAAVTVIQLLAALASVGIPRVLGSMVDLVSGAPGADAAGRLQGLIAVVIALAIGNAALTGCGEYLARVLGERVFAELRERLVGSAMHLPLSVVESAGTGDLLGRTSRDLESIRNVVRRGISQILVIMLTLLTIVVAAVVTSPRLSPALIVPMLAVAPVLRWYLRHAVPAYRAMNAMWAEVDGVIAETADQAATVDAHALGARRNRILDRAMIEVWSTEQYTLWLRIVLITALGLGSFAPVIAVVAWGAWLAGHGAVTLGAITTVALYAVQLRTPVSEVTFWIDSLQSAGAAMSRIVGVELVRPDREPTSGAVTGRPPRVCGVSYAYRPGHDVLHEVDLELIPGERLAVVGPSGSGKSTLGRMLAGIHPPTRGRVIVGDGDEGGIDLTALTEDALHREVALVTQEHHVFACTLADNLRLARTDATDAELERALEVVGAADWARELSDGLGTLVGAGGVQLTPGQAQQVALARIVLMDPATLVLDEATSLLDPGVARSAERSLDAVLAGRTVVAIAHRLDTAAAADRVAVVIGGRIVELGPHAELLAAGGEYTRLWQAWTSD
ncbi:ABC-type multidrug transport system, ATPase and permease component [Actinomyces ruminicola]|uniref:ABC-type multidrug transport system, ATPase and permease component n=1 Tax=Actinomyces ruminicola TaxID=332524 RepID=A0A1H0E112_9ACTO|nr:ABC transporter ATP-binding protein [Actinomyces ruminicola]SDN76207.1 ABC-type multidrug transport system, ATPase and permease component [Actinomyces ruminicola]